MDKQTVVLITGANRGKSFAISSHCSLSLSGRNKIYIYISLTIQPGIGLGLANLYLADAQATVILTTRTDPNNLRETLPETFPATLLGIYRFDSTSDTAAYSLAEELATKISRIDIVIANAGTGESFMPVRATSPDQLREYFEVNSLGPFKLYQGMSALLDKSAEPKFILVSSVLGSITEMNSTPCGAYGASKAAANFLVRKIHLEEERVVTVALHPG
jgi:norsolorinic acid ketoreductase